MVERRRPRGVGEAAPRSTQRSDVIASLNEMIAGLVDLDVKGLRLQWRNHLGGTQRRRGSALASAATC